MSQHALSAAYRWQVASRVLAAALGGYAAAAAATVLLALVWPLPPAHAVLASTMLSFVWYTLAVIWVFSVRTATRGWFGVLGAAAVMASLSVLIKWGS